MRATRANCRWRDTWGTPSPPVRPPRTQWICWSRSRRTRWSLDPACWGLFWCTPCPADTGSQTRGPMESSRCRVSSNRWVWHFFYCWEEALSLMMNSLICSNSFTWGQCLFWRSARSARQRTARPVCRTEPWKKEKIWSHYKFVNSSVLNEINTTLL